MENDFTFDFATVLFVEGAQVFDTTNKYDKTIAVDGKQVPLLNEKDNNMRFSAGAGFTWITPIGPISLRYAVPINDKDKDKIDNVQFEIGRTF